MLARGMTTSWLMATEQASWSGTVLVLAKAAPLQVRLSSCTLAITDGNLSLEGSTCNPSAQHRHITGTVELTS